MTLTCDAPTSNFSSGCELLLHYDADNDGLINLTELNQSYDDYENGIITEAEFDYVSDAYIHGSINVVCPGCYSCTCGNPTEHFPTGCDLLLHYDRDSSGIITIGELSYAYNDVGIGEISMDEYNFISEAYEAGSIVNLCPGCAAPQKRTVTFNSVPPGASVGVIVEHTQ